MVSTITIIVKSAMLVYASAVAEPVGFCTVQIQGEADYSLFESPEGGCTALGERYKRSAEAAYPESVVLLVVDGVSHQSM